MWETWIEYCKKSDLAQDTIPYESSEWISWLNYTGKNYHEPLPVASASDWNDK